IDIEQKILIGRPDIALLPVGGGPKAYTPLEATDALKMLNPKIIIPTHYRTEAADPATCELVAVDEFLTLVDGIPVRKVAGDTIALSPTDLPNEGPIIEVLSYNFDDGVSAQQ
ncbi:MAG: Zn-dependent hydrolase, partial [Okeania sp. SIO2H7]|nr:Zn-dependent hydrolase [Okeania sp. SIO2H7]